MKKSEPAHAPDFIWPVRVYYEDTDAAGVVFYANYLKFMERARTEWLRSLGFEQTTLMHEHNVVFVVRSLAVEYLRPAALQRRARDHGDADRDARQPAGNFTSRAPWQRVLVSGDVRVACVNTQSFRPVRIPPAILDKLATRKA